MNIVHNNYDELFSLNNLFRAWRKFRRGKTQKTDVMNFELHLEDNLFRLFDDLNNDRYQHSRYIHFQVFDDKKRDICKANVRDRIVHQIIFDYLASIFEPLFISNSYASRKNKGQYKAINALKYFIKLAFLNNESVCVLKCDVKKYFDSVDQYTLLKLIRERIVCDKTFGIIDKIVRSYSFDTSYKGIPLGNITSQIFANIYLNVLDQYIKKELKCRFYVRYNDDFVIISNSMEKLETMRDKIIDFVDKNLKLMVPIEKTCIRKAGWGIEFLGINYKLSQALMFLLSKIRGFQTIQERKI